MRVPRATIGANSATFDISVSGEPPPNLLLFAAGRRATVEADLKLGYSPERHLLIEDAEGRPYTLTANSTAPPAADGRMDFHVVATSPRPIGPPVRLRYFAVAGVATEVPFSFANLPIPKLARRPDPTPDRTKARTSSTTNQERP